MYATRSRFTMSPALGGGSNVGRDVGLSHGVYPKGSRELYVTKKKRDC